MINAIIKKMTLQNFANYGSAEVDFDKNKTIINGRSKMGKTTLRLAYGWCLGIAYQGFAPTINEYIVKNLETAVEQIWEVNGYEYTIKRVGVQKWAIDQNTQLKSFCGNDFKYIFDGVECNTLKDFKTKISSLFLGGNCDYSNIEMLTNLSYFNSEDGTKWNWKTRRSFIFDALHIQKQVQALWEQPKFNLICIDLKKNVDELDLKKKLSAERINIQNQKNKNEIISTDTQVTVAQLAEINFEEWSQKKIEIENEQIRLNNNSRQANKNDLIDKKSSEVEKIRQQIYAMSEENATAKKEYLNKDFDLKQQLSEVQNDIKILIEKQARLESESEETSIDILRLKDTAFDSKKMICPTCNQQLPKERIDELVASFEKTKAEKLLFLRDTDFKTSQELTSITERVNVRQSELDGIKGQISALHGTQMKYADTAPLESKILEIQSEIQELKFKNVNTAIETQKKELADELATANIMIYKETELVNAKNKIQALKNDNRELEFKEQQNLIVLQQVNEYIQEKIQLVNDKVNELFEGVEFNFFKWNTAGAVKDFEDVCECIQDGTKYEKCSTGQKIYADLCVNNALQKMFETNLPQWVDEKQSITLDLPKSQHQQIFLVTDESQSETSVLSNVTLVRNAYTLDDCDIRGGKQ